MRWVGRLLNGNDEWIGESWQGSHLGGADGVQGRNGNGSDAARTRWLSLIPLRLQSGLGTWPAAGVNGSKTGMKTNHRFEEVAIREVCGLLLLCAHPITHRVSFGSSFSSISHWLEYM